MMFSFEVPGEPTAKGRPRFSHNGKFVKAYTPQKTINYENLVKLSFMQQIGSPEPMHNEVKATVNAYFGIPASTSKKKYEQMIDGSLRPSKKPDCDNIAKIILDALNGIAYDDDKQITCLVVNKFYSQRPCVMVSLEELD